MIVDYKFYFNLMNELLNLRKFFLDVERDFTHFYF